MSTVTAMWRNTFASCVAGVLTVATSINAVEQLTSSDTPPFESSFTGGSRFDQTTYTGRFQKMLLACDPTLILYPTSHVLTLHSKIASFRTACERNGGTPPTPLTPAQNRDLWEYHRIVSSALYPTTGEPIPQPFRMSGLMPFNAPLCIGMITAGSTPALLAWSWLNQSQNALVNYYNRGASSKTSNEDMAKSYVGAVGSALGVSFTLATFVKRRWDPVRAKQLMQFVALPSSIIASSINCYIVRSPEIEAGVGLMDEEHRAVVMPGGETSRIAATKGVYETVLSRALVNVPVFLVPPAIMATVPYFKNAAKRGGLAVFLPMTTYLMLLSFGLGLPMVIAIFPQYGSIQADKLEAPFREVYTTCKISGKSELRRSFVYDKGL